MKYSTYYFVFLLAFATWLSIFGRDLNEIALVSLLAIVLLGFSVLGYAHKQAASGGTGSLAAKASIAVVGAIILDIVLPAPHMYEVIAQALLVGVLIYWLRRKGLS